MCEFEKSDHVERLDAQRANLPKAGDVLTRGLDLEGHSYVTALADNLIIHGDLQLRGTALSALPSGLRVYGNVELEGLETLVSLGEHTAIDGDLSLEGCSALRHLPDYLQVGGDIFLAGSGIKIVPTTNRIGGKAHNLGESKL